MAKRDSLSRTYPLKIRYQSKDLADSSRLIGFQKLTEQAFMEIERAVGDLYNTENAQNSILSNNPLFMNSLGRALGSMSNLEPTLSGVDEFSPTLANRLIDTTYNVIPHPDQAVKCEVGCTFDGYDPSDQTVVRKCLAGFDAFYRQQEGSNTTVCQAVQCPGWSGRDGQLIELSSCDPDSTSKTFREYKLVVPTEARNVDTFGVKYYSNCGASPYDRFRSDTGQVNFDSINKTDPSRNWALATTDLIVSGTTSSVQYDYPDLSETSSFILVVEIPRLDLGQTLSINNVSFGLVNGSSSEPTRYLFDLSNLNIGTSMSVRIEPADDSDGEQAAVSQIFVIEKANSPHRNFGQPLLLPKALEGLSAGTEIPPNFVQVFDTDTSVNRMLDKVLTFSARFEIPGETNLSTARDSYNIRIFDNQSLEISNDRYITVTVGMDVATTVGALLEAFVEHVSDPDIHISEDRICELLQDKTACCADSYVVQVQSLTPANREASGPGDTYSIKLWIYGGTPIYDIDIDWGDGLSDTDLSIVSGVQTFELGEDRNPSFGEPFEISHQYAAKGTYELSLVVTDDTVNGFGCSSDISSLVSPFNVGSPPEIDLEVRLDNISSFAGSDPALPVAYVFQDIEAGYNFTETPASDWSTADVNYHIMTQVHNTDTEDGKPSIFQWIIDNPDGLTYQFYYENVTEITGESLVFITSSGTLVVSGFVQQDSLVLKRADGQVLVQDTDYLVNWLSGTVTAVVGQSISANETVTAKYFHYAFMTRGDDPTTLSTQQWTALNGVINTAQIDINVVDGERLTPKQDINTIRFKQRT